MKILIRKAGLQAQHSIINTISITKPTLRKLNVLLIAKMAAVNATARKLGGSERLVQADETMLNFKCKSHKGRSPENRTDAIYLSYFKYNIENKFYNEFIDWHTTIEWHTYPNGYSALRARLQRQIIIRPRDSLGDDGKVLEEERILEK